MLGRTFASRCVVRRSLAEGWRIRAVGNARQELRLRRGLAFAAALALLAALLIAPPAAGQSNAIVKQVNLAQLAQGAHTIVEGQVIGVRIEPHPQMAKMQTLVVTLEIKDVWKGQTGAPFSFRQFVSEAQDIQSNLNYKVGQEVLLFMTRPSKYGLSSPVGLDQGRFRIFRDAQGNRLATNGLNNRGLFRKVSQTHPNLALQLNATARNAIQAHSSGAIEYDQLKGIVLAVLAGSTN